MSRFSCLAEPVPSEPVLKAETPRSSIIFFCPTFASIEDPVIKQNVLLLLCKFYNISFDDYLIECTIHELDEMIGESGYNSVSIEMFEKEYLYPAPGVSRTKKSVVIYETFTKCIAHTFETETDRNNLNAIEFRSFLREYWNNILSLRMQDEDYDGEFDFEAYMYAIRLMHELYPSLPFYFKANAFIDVIGPHVMCSVSNAVYVPVIGTNEYASACELIHTGAYDMIVVNSEDSELVCTDKTVYPGDIEY